MFGSRAPEGALSEGLLDGRGRSRSPHRDCEIDLDLVRVNGGVQKYSGKLCSNAFALQMARAKDLKEPPFLAARA
jgi:hypothetical protein